MDDENEILSQCPAPMVVTSLNGKPYREGF